MSSSSNLVTSSAAVMMDRRFNGCTKKFSTSGSTRTTWKLRYQDFLPERRSRSSNQTESFQSLVNRANEWRRRNFGMRVNGCETVTWMSHDRKRLNDGEQMLMARRITKDSKTYFLRGLRLWLVPSGKPGRSEEIGYRDFLPERPLDTVDMLIAKANKKFSHSSNKSQILSTETICVPITKGDCIDSEITEWSESVNGNKPYTFAVRIFYTKPSGSAQNGEVSNQGSGIYIGFKDMVPILKGDEYEGFEELIDRSNCWLKDQSDIRLTNMQSLTLQKNSGSESSGNVCYFTMPGLDNDPTTEFFRILRIAFVRISEKSLSASADLPIAYPFTFRTFSPELLRSGSDVGEGTSAQTEPTCRMETMRETFARGLAYLKAAGVDLICAETVLNPIELYNDNDTEELQSVEEMSFLFTIRLYVTDQVRRSSSQQDDSRPTASLLKPILSKTRSNCSPTLMDSSGVPGAGDRPGPIFLRNVVTRRYQYRWLAVAIFALSGMSVIVALSVVYSNK